MSARRRDLRDESGAIAVMVGLLAVVLFLIAGLVVDLGIARDTRRQSQNAADAAALAGVNELYPANNAACADGSSAPCLALAWDAARRYAEQNISGIDWTRCPAAPAGYKVAPASPTCVSFDNLTKPSRMWVVIPPRDVKTGFGALAGVETITIMSSARAFVGVEGNYECGLCVVGAGPHSPGNGDITVSGASIMFNGDYIQGNSSDNGVIRVTTAGQIISVEKSKQGGGSFDPDLIVPGPHVNDPLAALQFPLPGTSSFTGPLKSQPCQEDTKAPAQGPGIYGAVDLPKGDCTLLPGLYVIVDTWQFSNNTTLRGNGITLYGTCRSGDAPLVCGPNGVGGSLAGKNGNMDFSAPASGPLRGLAIVYDRHNTAVLDLQGNGDARVTGSIYAPNAPMTFPGNSTFTIRNGRAVVGSVQSNGNDASLTIDFQPSTVDVPRVLESRLDR